MNSSKIKLLYRYIKGDSANALKHVFVHQKVLPKTISVPIGFSKLKPFWVSEPPSGSRTMSTPAERQNENKEIEWKGKIKIFISM